MYPPILPGTLLHQRYRLVGILAQGTLGWIYLAEDQKRMGDLCVLKEFIVPGATPDRLNALRDTFQEEAALLYELQHPQIPRFRVVIAEAERLFWVEEYIAGKSFQVQCDEQRAQGVIFSEAAVVQWLSLILPVLSYIHSRGVIHGNLSPKNLILRDRDQLPVLINFGTVKQIATKLQLTGGEEGQPLHSSWLPIADLAQSPFDRGIDLYGLAVTALVLLTGQDPQTLYDAETQTWQWQEWVTLSPRFSSILRQLLPHKNKLRHCSADQIVRALKPLLTAIADHPESVVLPNPVKPLPPPEVASTPVGSSEPISSVQSDPHPVVTGQGKSMPAEGVVPQVKARRSGKKAGVRYPQTAAVLGLSIVLVIGVVAWERLSSVRRSPANAPPPAPTEASSTAPIAPSNPGVTVPPKPTAPVSNQKEDSIQTALRDRRRKLDISYDFFVDLVDEAFYTRYPDLKGKRLTNQAQQAQLRIAWNEIAEALLDRLELLSSTARSQLGKYSGTDYERGIAIARSYNVSDRTLRNLTNVRFSYLFPEQQQQDVSSGKFSQVWYAVLSDQIRSIQAKATVTSLSAKSQRPLQTGGVLKPGQGRVYVVYLEKGQPLRLELQAPTQSTQLSIYSPAGDGTQPLLQNSTELSWSGAIPRSGYYEIVIVSYAPEAVGYRLKLS